MVGDEAYYRKRFDEAMDEHDILDPYAATADVEVPEDSPLFQEIQRKRESFIDKLIVELGF